MTEQLPVISTFHNVSTTEQKSTSLIGRGLSAIQHKKTGLARSELDVRYRQARDIYNRITDYGLQRRFNSEAMPKRGEQLDVFEYSQLQPFFAMLQQLADVFTVFQQLADQGYGKAYVPLAIMYWGGQGISKNIEKSYYYSRLAVEWYFNNQALDDPEIWVELGLICECGCYVELDYEQAVFWYRKAAEQGHADAQECLGSMYKHGHGVEQDCDQAVFWYSKAAEQGNAEAQYHLGEMYGNGRLIELDYEQAVFWYHKAAEQGSAFAQFNLGVMYANGHIIEEGKKQAVFWISKAAKQGYASAQLYLGLMHEIVFGEDNDDNEAVFWIRKAAELRYRNWAYFDGFGVTQDTWIRKAAEKAAEIGNTRAQFYLGKMYDAVELDEEQAIFWYRNAAEQGDVEAQYHLGLMYEGYVDQGEEQAVFWFRKAAEQGNAKAQFHLGSMYDDGDICFEDDNNEQAVFWWRKAAEQGHTDAQACLGWKYYDEYGAGQDDEQALFWWSKAAEQDHANEQFKLDWMYATIIRNENTTKQKLIEHFGITDSQAEAILELKLKQLTELEEMIHLLSGQPDDWYVLASHFGNGFRVQLKELLSKDKAGKLLIALPDGAQVLKPVPIHNESDLLAVVTLRGRLLIFPVADLPALARGKGSKLIQIPATDLAAFKEAVVAVLAIPEHSHLKVFSGKRFLTLKAADIEHYTDSRAEKGLLLPRGFERVDGLIYE